MTEVLKSKPLENKDKKQLQTIIQKHKDSSQFDRILLSGGIIFLLILMFIGFYVDPILSGFTAIFSLIPITLLIYSFKHVENSIRVFVRDLNENKKYIIRSKVIKKGTSTSAFTIPKTSIYLKTITYKSHNFFIETEYHMYITSNEEEYNTFTEGLEAELAVGKESNVVFDIKPLNGS